MNGSTRVKDWLDEREDAEQTQIGRPETQEVTDRPREKGILKGKVF